jgi:hypothetical protein
VWIMEKILVEFNIQCVDSNYNKEIRKELELAVKKALTDMINGHLMEDLICEDKRYHELETIKAVLIPYHTADQIEHAVSEAMVSFGVSILDGQQ